MTKKNTLNQSQKFDRFKRFNEVEHYLRQLRQ
jgi:hypothetical protein